MYNEEIAISLWILCGQFLSVQEIYGGYGEDGVSAHAIAWRGKNGKTIYIR